MFRHIRLACLGAFAFTACLESQPGTVADTAQPDGQHDAALPEPSGTFRLTARLLGAFEAQACIDVAVSNGVATLWRRGDPAATRSGGDQRLAPRDRVAGQTALDTETLCVTNPTPNQPAVFELVAPCDPTRDTAPERAGVQNTLTLWVDDVDLRDPDRTLEPCPNGCTLTFDCSADTTTAISFDAAIVFRDGAQGFAETADIFDQAWCSAKYHSCLKLLFNDDGVRVESGILAIACSAREADLAIDLGRISVVCETHRFDLQPTKQGPDEARSNDARLGFATYAGVEDFGGEWTKTYFNLAFQMPDLLSLDEDCHVEWTATSHVPDRELFTADRPTADGLVYPFFRMKVPVTRSGELVCETSTLDDRRFVDVELYGTTGQHEALPPRCFRAQGETLTATNALGCAD